MNKLRDFIVYRSDDFYAIAPTVCRARDGGLIVGFRRMPNRQKEGRWNMHIDTESHVVLATSGDGGGTWSEPRRVEATLGVGQQSAQLTTLSDGRILLGSFRWGIVDAEREEDMGGPHVFTRAYHRRQPNNPWKGVFKMMGGMVCHSDDHGRTFTPWRTVGVPKEKYLEGLCAIEGKVAELPSGRLLLPVYATTTGPSYCALCLASEDRGETWSFLSAVAQNPHPKGPSFDEHSLTRLGNGDVVSFHRSTWDIHDAIWLSRSCDEGKTWKLERLNGVIGHPTKGVVLSDGRVLMVYGYRHFPRAGVRLRLLDPECRDIASAPEFIVRDDAVPADRPPDKGMNTDFGYPDAIEIEPGLVLVVYYFPDPVAGGHIAASLVRI
jgi:hypothetical protein